MRSCTKKAMLQYLTCQTQGKERPQPELELFSRMTDQLVNLFNKMSMIHEWAVEFLTSIEKNSQESFFQVSASPDQIDSETFHRVSASPDQIDSETFHRVSAPPGLDSSGISHQVSAHNLDQKSTGEGWEHNEPSESDEPIQEIPWYDIPGVPQIDVCQPTVTEAHGMRQNSEAMVEQDGSHQSPKITLGQLSECPPQVDTCQHSVSETVNDKHGSKIVITQVRPNSNPPITPGQHVECPQKEMQCKSKCMKTEKFGQNTVKPQHPELNKTNSKLKSKVIELTNQRKRKGQHNISQNV